MPLPFRDPIYQGKLQMSDTTQFVEINPDAQLILRLPKVPCFARAHFPRVPIHLDISSYQPPEGEFDTIICSFRVQALRTQEAEDFIIQLHLFGEKASDVYWSFDPASVLSNNLKELSNADFELLSWCAFPSCGNRSGVAPLLADSLWQDTLGKLAMCRQQSLGRVIKDLDCSYFPTLTSNVSTTSANLRFAQIQRIWEKQSFSAGQTKCEKWFKDNGLIKSGYQLGTQAMPTASFAIAQTMGFPSSWFEGLTQQYPQGIRYSKNLTTLSQVKPQAESEQGISQDEQLHQHKQPLPSAESSTSTQLSDAPWVLGGKEELLEHEWKSSSSSSEVLLGGEDNSPLSTESSSSVSQKISIPCLVKQPKQPEVKGIIKEDKGDRFLVEVDGEEILISKLFVYPDFSKTVGQIPPTKKATPPSKSGATPRRRKTQGNAHQDNSLTKTRRKKGDGTGYIYRRTVTRKGKQYQESYFRYRDESGKLKAKYIPQKLLCKVEEAESAKKPIADILVLLGGDGINRGEQSSTSISTFDNDPLQTSQTSEQSDELIPVSRGEQPTPPSKRKRKQGEGTGYIECKPIKRSGKEYKQYWYHYEEWREGDRTSKKSKYISKGLVTRVEKMEREKEAVEEILKILRHGSKRK